MSSNHPAAAIVAGHRRALGAVERRVLGGSSENDQQQQQTTPPKSLDTLRDEFNHFQQRYIQALHRQRMLHHVAAFDPDTMDCAFTDDAVAALQERSTNAQLEMQSRQQRLRDSQQRCRQIQRSVLQTLDQSNKSVTAMEARLRASMAKSAATGAAKNGKTSTIDENNSNNNNNNKSSSSSSFFASQSSKKNPNSHTESESEFGGNDPENGTHLSTSMMTTNGGDENSKSFSTTADVVNEKNKEDAEDADEDEDIEEEGNSGLLFLATEADVERLSVQLESQTNEIARESSALLSVMQRKSELDRRVQEINRELESVAVDEETLSNLIPEPTIRQQAIEQDVRRRIARLQGIRAWNDRLLESIAANGHIRVNNWVDATSTKSKSKSNSDSESVSDSDGCRSVQIEFLIPKLSLSSSSSSSSTCSDSQDLTNPTNLNPNSVSKIASVPFSRGDYHRNLTTTATTKDSSNDSISSSSRSMMNGGGGIVQCKLCFKSDDQEVQEGQEEVGVSSTTTKMTSSSSSSVGFRLHSIQNLSPEPIHPWIEDLISYAVRSSDIRTFVREVPIRLRNLYALENEIQNLLINSPNSNSNSSDNNDNNNTDCLLSMISGITVGTKLLVDAPGIVWTVVNIRWGSSMENKNQTQNQNQNQNQNMMNWSATFQISGDYNPIIHTKQFFQQQENKNADGVDEFIRLQKVELVSCCGGGGIGGWNHFNNSNINQQSSLVEEKLRSIQFGSSSIFGGTCLSSNKGVESDESLFSIMLKQMISVSSSSSSSS